MSKRGGGEVTHVTAGVTHRVLTNDSAHRYAGQVDGLSDNQVTVVLDVTQIYKYSLEFFYELLFSIESTYLDDYN